MRDPDATWAVGYLQQRRLNRLPCNRRSDLLKEIEGVVGCRYAGNHALLVTAAATLLPHGLKTLFDQTRPDRTTVVGHLHGISLSGKREDAFPSGHAASSWALAEVVAEEYRDRPVVRWSAYGLAAAVSVARVTSLAHSPSDVFVGGVIGYLVGRHVVRRGDPGVGHISLVLTPVVSTPTKTFGVSGSLAF